MLTRKDLNGLKFLFRLLKGEHKDFIYILDLLKERYAFDNKTAFEIAFLYDKNYQSDGDFTNITNPKRMGYELYANIPNTLIVLMEYLEDMDEDNYEESNTGYGYSADSIYEHDGITYFIYDRPSDIVYEAKNGAHGDWLCEDYEFLESYLHMSETDKRLIASDESENWVDNMTRSDIIDYGDLKDEIEEIENDEEHDDNEKEVYIDDLLDSTMRRLKEDKYDEVKDQLDSNFVSYFIDNGFYEDIRQLILHGPVTFDCDDVKKDYINDLSTDDLYNFIGFYQSYETTLGDKKYVILYNN